MEKINQLIDKNESWASAVKEQDPDFFNRLSKQQTPDYLWIGCSDSRVPPNRITDLPPGEIFVHRNIANLVIEDDLNCQSVVQYAVEVLKVKHIIICGHYGCGGVVAALDNQSLGRMDDWLAHIKQIAHSNASKLKELEPKEKSNLLCELNIIQQVANISRTDIVQNAWKKGAELSVHGLIYSLENGTIHDLDTTISSIQDIKELEDS